MVIIDWQTLHPSHKEAIVNNLLESIKAKLLDPMTAKVELNIDCDVDIRYDPLALQRSYNGRYTLILKVNGGATN